MVKTIEQILAISPMNQKDRAAEPMTGAFTNTANLKPFSAVPNQIPLTYGLKVTTPSGSKVGAVARQAVPSVPAAAESIAAQWQVWSTHQSFGAPGRRGMPPTPPS